MRIIAAVSSARVLVTGGAGFLGSHLAEELVSMGHAVVVLDDLSGGVADNVPEGARFVEASILDEARLASLFAEERFEVVYHLAAYAAEGLSHHVRCFNYTNNVVGSMAVLNAAIRHGTRRFVFTSSIAVYGTGELPLRETHVPRPEDPYGVAKLAVEQDLAAATRHFGIEHTIFRPHNLYGERQSMRDRYRNVVGIFLNQAMRGEALTVFGDGEQTRAFTYVRDVVPAMARSAWMEPTKGQVFNVGGDRAYAVRELAEVVRRVTGLEPSVRNLPARDEVTHAWSDHTRFRDTFGAHAETSLEDGMRHTWAWASALGPQDTPAFPAIELEQGLPEIWRR